MSENPTERLPSEVVPSLNLRTRMEIVSMSARSMREGFFRLRFVRALPNFTGRVRTEKRTESAGFVAGVSSESPSELKQTSAAFPGKDFVVKISCDACDDCSEREFVVPSMGNQYRILRTGILRTGKRLDPPSRSRMSNVRRAMGALSTMNLWMSHP